MSNEKSAKELRDELGIGPDTVMTGLPFVLEEEDESLAQILHRPLLTPDECQAIIDLAKDSDAMRDSMVVADGEGVIDTKWRKAQHMYLLPGPDTNELLDKLMTTTLFANKKFKFDIDAFEAVSIVRYPVGGHYSWHKDIGSKHTAHRKISMSVQLSADHTYEGGDLEIDLHSKVFRAPRERGSVTVFCSWERHRVTPVLRGERWAIVAWAAGRYRFR